MSLLETLGFAPGGPEDEQRRAQLLRAFEAIREAERAIWCRTNSSATCDNRKD